tara:strand:+ start:436 stop:549 length:114 start_codon:yes stop_codon:yes gene_type:complete
MSHHSFEEEAKAVVKDQFDMSSEGSGKGKDKDAKRDE